MISSPNKNVLHLQITLNTNSETGYEHNLRNTNVKTNQWVLHNRKKKLSTFNH